MPTITTSSDIDEKFQKKIYAQDYAKKPEINGVKILKLENVVTEDGDFSELLRLNENGEMEGIAGFKPVQINRSKILPLMVKAWHLHLRQDEIWYVLPDGHLLIGLWDVRKDSPTKDTTMRVVLGGGKSKLLFIPKGVAHGCSNFSKKPANILYFVSQKFNRENPDEQRLAWDSKGADFWQPKKD